MSYDIFIKMTDIIYSSSLHQHSGSVEPLLRNPQVFSFILYRNLLFCGIRTICKTCEYLKKKIPTCLGSKFTLAPGFLSPDF